MRSPLELAPANRMGHRSIPRRIHGWIRLERAVFDLGGELQWNGARLIEFGSIGVGLGIAIDMSFKKPQDLAPTLLAPNLGAADLLAIQANKI